MSNEKKQQNNGYQPQEVQKGYQPQSDSSNDSGKYGYQPENSASSPSNVSNPPGDE